MRRWSVGLILSLACGAALALNPAIRLEDLNHASWTIKDGAPTDVMAMAQTRDGWLWLGGHDGLYRFDGVSFERYPLKHNLIASLYARSNGDLLVSIELGEVLVLHPDGSVTDLGSPVGLNKGTASSLAADSEGVIWTVGGSGLHRYAHGKWEAISSGPQWAARRHSILVDQYNRTWASTDRALYVYTPGAGKLEQVAAGDTLGSLVLSPDGRLWTAAPDGLHPVSAPSVGQKLPRQPDFNQSESRRFGQFDRDGNFWALGCPAGICRVSGAGSLPSAPLTPSRQAQQKLDQPWQLTSISADSLLEDREGNIWIATRGGLDRYRENKLVAVHMPAPSGMFTAAADTEGRLWMAQWHDRSLWRMSAGGDAVRDPGRVVSVLANDRDGALLLAGRRDIERIYQGKSSRIALPAPGGKPVDLDVIGLQDDGKILWMASLQTGPMGLVDGRWVPFSQFKYPRPVFMTAPAGPGALWLAHNNGSMSLADNGKITAYDISAVGQVSGIFPGPQVLVGGELGVAALLGDKFVLLGPAGVEALRNVTGAAVTPDGDRWLNGAKGAVHIRRADWEAALRHPAAPLAYELIDAQEGYPGRAALDNRLPSLYSGGNGRLWFRTTSGLARLDTASLQTNPVKPVAQLLRVVTASSSYPAGALLRLPPDTRSFDIQYTAPGLRKPEGMRFQYLLEGVDQDWRDAGTRRAAYYTNIGPGRYRFSVRAVNEDGVAGDATSSMQIEVAPTVTQTGWFRALCVLAAALLLYGLYKYRLNVVKAALARQLQARTDERERIARTLHDTFLQSVQALILRVHAVLMKLPEGSEPRNKLADILDDADRAVGEGRNQVRQLRSGQDIEQHLRESGASLAAIYTSTSFTLDVAGERCQLSPPAQEEVCAICAEALRNAFQHAHASAVAVRIDYRDAMLLFAVSDNGRGIEDAEVRARQQQNHWGVVGMRERARSIGGELDIASLPGRGTFVTLRVPRTLACAEGATSA